MRADDTTRHNEHSGAEELARRNIETIMRSEEAVRSRRGVSDRIADAVSRFCGSMPFVYVHFLLYGGWLAANMFLPPEQRWDPFPFAVLTLIASSEAIFLSTFVLISQNRQARLSERRDHLELQINLLNEQESTQILRLLNRIADRLGMAEEARHDPAARAYQEMTSPEKLLHEIDKTIQQSETR